jgi:hypothetical protein
MARLEKGGGIETFEKTPLFRPNKFQKYNKLNKIIVLSNLRHF